MALAAKHIQARFNKEDITLFDQYIYTLVGDGDLQEGVALEALSLAGHLKLSNLVILLIPMIFNLMVKSNIHFLKIRKRKWKR